MYVCEPPGPTSGRRIYTIHTRIQTHSLGSIYLRGLFVYTYKHITNDFLLIMCLYIFAYIPAVRSIFFGESLSSYILFFPYCTIPLVPSLPLFSAYIYTPETMHGTSRFISQSTSLHRFCRFCTATYLLFKQDAVPLMVMVSQPRNTLFISIWFCMCISRWVLEGWGDAGMGV